MLCEGFTDSILFIVSVFIVKEEDSDDPVWERAEQNEKS